MWNFRYMDYFAAILGGSMLVTLADKIEKILIDLKKLFVDYKRIADKINFLRHFPVRHELIYSPLHYFLDFRANHQETNLNKNKVIAKINVKSSKHITSSRDSSAWALLFEYS